MSIFRAAKEKITLVAAVTLAAIVGGATTGMVMAAVPDGAAISSCYKTTGGELRVLDGVNAACANDETALDLADAAAKANTAFMYYNGTESVQAVEQNITAFDFVDINNDNVSESMCIQTAFSPSSINAYGPEGFEFNSIVEKSTDPGYIDDRCGDSKYNALVYGVYDPSYIFTMVAQR